MVILLILWALIKIVPANECPFVHSMNWMPEDRLVSEDYQLHTLQPFSSNIFNSLRDVNEVIKDRHDVDEMLAKDKMVCSLGQTLVEQGMNMEIGVSVLHNHFQLEDNEYMLLKEASGDAIFIGSVMTKENVTEDTQPIFVPYMFKFDDNQNIYPLQYIVDYDGTLTAKFQDLISNDLRNIAHLLKTNNMLDKIGIFIRYYDGPTFPLNEQTDVKRREQWFTTELPQSANTSTLITAYTFDASDGYVYQNCEIGCVWYSSCFSDCETDNDDKHYSSHHDHGHHETGHR
eukprot:434225_1